MALGGRVSWLPCLGQVRGRDDAQINYLCMKINENIGLKSTKKRKYLKLSEFIVISIQAIVQLVIIIRLDLCAT